MIEIPTCERHLGARIKALNHAFMRRHFEIARAMGLDDCSIMHGHILGLLHWNRDRDVFQKDLEEIFFLSRSSVAALMKTMEQKGYLRRVPVPQDARLKKLVLTERGEEVFQLSFAAIRATEARAIADIPQEDLDAFFAVTARIRQNLSDPKGKEGPHDQDPVGPSQGL